MRKWNLRSIFKLKKNRLSILKSGCTISGHDWVWVYIGDGSCNQKEVCQKCHGHRKEEEKMMRERHVRYLYEIISPCGICNGTGYNLSNQSICMNCEGRGKITQYNNGRCINCGKA